MHRFTLRQLEYLVACVDCGSVAAAAARLNVSQPTISVALNRLEARLGVQLLLRHPTRGVIVTAAGGPLLHLARSLLGHASDLERQAMETGTALAGELRLGSFSTLAPVVLPGLIRALAELHPQIRLHLREGPQDRIVADLREGRLDMALLYDLDLPLDLDTTLLARRSPYAALAPDHPLARQESVALADLAAEPMILLEVAPSRDYFLGLFHAAGLSATIAHASPSIELVRGMVGRGLGYALLVTRPDGDRTYDGHALAVRPLRDAVPPSRIVLARVATLRPTRLMARVTELAVRQMGPGGGSPGAADHRPR